MSNHISLELWNQCTLALVQALLGAVSPNFRMVTLSHAGGTWRIHFVLEHESNSDSEEIEDVAAEFDALQSSPIRYEVETTVSAGTLAWPAAPTRVVFRRKDS
jgi:hypothetical protein